MKSIQLWDPVIRIFHASVAVVFVANYFVNEAGEDWHEYLGYYAFAGLIIRFAWGFIGSGAARWRDYWQGFAAIKNHFNCLVTRKSFHRLGHTPLGAVVMLMMLMCILLLCATGFMMEEVDMFWGEDWVQDTHHWIANLLCGLVALHLIAAVYHSIKTRENLFLSMVTGKRRAGHFFRAG